MYSRSFTFVLFRVLLPLAFTSTTYLYLYPVFHGCAFPSPQSSKSTAFCDAIRQHGWSPRVSKLDSSGSIAPFRLLVFADPQLEGDSSLPKPEDAFLQRIAVKWATFRTAPQSQLWQVIADSLTEILTKDLTRELQALRKRVDLFGNDYYLAHIFRTLHWWSKPTHVTVLGDLIGSQWVTDEEFERRRWRYWNRVFAGGQKVDDEIKSLTTAGKEGIMNLDEVTWRRRIINIAGNHDIGYAGDASEKRLERFERGFGKANWDIRFQLASLVNQSNFLPTIHMIVLNTLTVDGPALSEEKQRESHDFINTIISQHSLPVPESSSFTLLLTHLPLYKDAGVCVDPPHFDYWGDDDGGGVYRPYGLREQNHLGKHASQTGILDPEADSSSLNNRSLFVSGRFQTHWPQWVCTAQATE